jgi:hypothetical protein
MQQMGQMCTLWGKSYTFNCQKVQFEGFYWWEKIKECSFTPRKVCIHGKKTLHFLQQLGTNLVLTWY